METATFGAGCFWGIEHAFRQLDGVLETEVGFMGGDKDDPTYKQVCTEPTGHAEVVTLKFDPARVKYEELLQAFWMLHDPTQLNRQGPDVGEQYRSVLFFHSNEQKTAAEASKEAEAKRHRRPVVTAIEPATHFWRAEDYHQQYLEKRGMASCRI